MMHDDTPADLGPMGRAYGEWSELYGHYAHGTEDEREVMLMVSRQMHGKGRKEYGPLILSGDKRNFPREALAEVIDTTFYLAVSLVKLARWWDQLRSCKCERCGHTQLKEAA